MLTGIHFILSYTCNFKCHLCYCCRKEKRSAFPDQLAPPQLYGEG